MAHPSVVTGAARIGTMWATSSAGLAQILFPHGSMTVSMDRVYHQGSGFGGSMRHFPMSKTPKDLYRVFAPGVPNVRVLSERLSEADARSRKREILMAYPAATVWIEKTDESSRNSRTPK
jgi:hypothetical protein